MVGEQMPITLAITTSGPIHGLEVVVKAEYLEGGGHSDLPILLPQPSNNTQPLQVGLHVYCTPNCYCTRGQQCLHSELILVNCIPRTQT